MIGKVVIAGRDVAGWLAALAIQRATAAMGVEVHLIELPATIQAADVCATLPAIEAFHRLLGIDEHDLLRATGGTFTLGQSFVNFSGGNTAFFHPYGSAGIALNRLPFLQVLTRARQGGLNVPFEDFSLTAAAAKHNRFIVPDSETESFARTDYGYHLPAQAYVAALKARAVKAGVKVTTARDVAIGRHPDSGDIVAVHAGGQRIAGDLFIDAGGPEALLMRQLGVPFESWRPWFGADRILSVAGNRLASLPPYGQVRAQPTGWLGLYAAQGATHLVQVYDSAHLNDDAALQSSAVVTGLTLGDAVAGPLDPGRSRSAWAHNCVAIGDAACTFDPIDAVGLHGAQLGLAHLLTLFPRGPGMAVERAEYNRLTGMAFARLRDFQLAHYAGNRVDAPFWQQAREAALPDSLLAKLDAFRARGILPLFDEESFHADSWHAVLLGHGIVPESYEPLVDAIRDEDIVTHLRRMLGYIRDQVQAATSHDAYLELFCA